MKIEMIFGGKTQNAHEQQQADIVDFRFGTAEQTHAGLHQRIDANDEQHHGHLRQR